MTGILPVDARIGEALVNNSRTVYSALVFDTFNSEGLYQKTDWFDKQLITEQLMDKIEDGIYWNRYDLHSKYDNVIVEEGEDEIELTFYSFNKILKTISFSKGSKDYNDLINTPTIPTKVSELENDKGYLIEIPSEYVTEQELEEKDYPTKEYVNDAITQAQLNEKEIDLSEYAKKTYVDEAIENIDIPTKVSELENDSNFISSIPSEYITETELESKNYPTKEYVDEQILNAKLDKEEVDLSDYARKTYVDEAIENIDIPTKTSELTNDSGFITSIPSEYITETELNNKGYLTEHQDISHKADKSELHNHINKAILDSITEEDIINWNNNQNNGMTDEERILLSKKFDDVVAIQEGEYVTLTFYSNGTKMKSVRFSVGGNIFISTTLSEDIFTKTNTEISIPLYFYSPNEGQGTVKILIDDVEVIETTVSQGESKVVIPSTLLSTVGNFNLKMYVVDSKTIISNALIFTLRVVDEEIAIYTATSKGVLPTFNDEFTYISNEVDNGDGTYTTSIYADNLDSLPTKINFENKTTLTNVDKLNTSNVTDMYAMFSNCELLISINSSDWDTSKVTSMYYMFNNCNKLTTLDVSNWNTSNVTSMYCMFDRCRALTELDVSNWNTSEVTSMYCMFNNCYVLTELDISNWNTSKVTDMGYMFASCQSLVSLKGINNIDTSKVTSMYMMFYDCGVTSLNLSNFDTSKVTSMYAMFNNCIRLVSLEGISNWDTSNVTDMYYMFNLCYKLTSSLDLSSWDINLVTNMTDMFCNCTELTDLKAPQNIKVSISFEKANNLTHTSLMSIINNLATVSSSRILTLGSTNKAKLTNSEIAIAINKGWTVA